MAEQASMLHARFAPGVIQVADYIYVFGGGEEQDLARTLCASERYNHKTNTWTSIQPLPAPKRSFNPALHQHNIYILGGWGTSLSFSYDWQADLYTQLPFSLPTDGVQGVTLMDKSEVIFISQGKKYVFYREPFQLKTEIDDTSIAVFPRSCVAPIQCGEYVYLTALYKTEWEFVRYFARYSFEEQEYRLIASYQNMHDQLH